MVEQEKLLDDGFRALADVTRRAMLRELATGDRTVSELARPFDISLAAASKHIKTLERAGMIKREIQGRTHLCRLETAAIANIQEWLAYYEKFWLTSLDALESALNQERHERSTSKKLPRQRNKHE